MPLKLRDVVEFGAERLFNGAVNLDWFVNDPDRGRLAAETFIFHGPTYHGVTQDDVGRSHGHQLQDTARFTRAVVRRCFGREDQPFTLAIAGYGTGKSHLAVALGSVLADQDDSVTASVLANLATADDAVGAEVRAILEEENQPCLVVALNGMRSFDLTAELARQVAVQLQARGCDPTALDQLRPRFSQTVSLIEMVSDAVVGDLLEAVGAQRIEPIIESLGQQDETTYSKVHDFFSTRGMQIRALGGESTRDVIAVVCREYCGTGKPFAGLVILFDEFGRYMEFATTRSQIAGSGVLQDLFEGIQDAESACFVGFIQFELNAYVQRMAPQYKNDILRYVTRYEFAASRSYLSTNLETLIAHVIDRKKPDLIDAWFDTEDARADSQAIMDDLHRRFPQSQHLHLWSDQDGFHRVIRKGCWPLSPYATWVLFYLAAAGKNLQERSALTLLADVFSQQGKRSLPADGALSLAPADLWSEDLAHELTASEETGQQGSIAHSYVSVKNRHETQLQGDLDQTLRAVVLAAKAGLQASDRDDAVRGLSHMAGLPHHTVAAAVEQLQEELNVLEWDDGFKQFDILGDSVPRTQFLGWLRQRVASSYDEAGKAQLFASRAADWCDLLGGLECDFAEDNAITTREWRYLGVTSNLGLLHTQLKFAVHRWQEAIAVDEPRGSIIYCYVDQQHDPSSVSVDAARLLWQAAREAGVAALPILLVLLCDEDGKVGQALAELAVLEDSVTEQDRAQFGHLIGAHSEKTLQFLQTRVASMIKERRYVAAAKEQPQARRLARVASELFGMVYKKPLPFPFDGFSTARGNAADTCQQLTTELLRGSLDYDSVIAMPVKAKNRGVAVLSDCWQVFTQRTGAVSRRPAHPVVRAVTRDWDRLLQEGEGRMAVSEVLRQLCAPPYGANIASAGLLLGVFVAPRVEQLMVSRDGESFSVSQWVQEELFVRKFLDLGRLDGVELIPVGDISSEWQALLDEWDQAESHSDRVDCLTRALELKARIPVPPALVYRYAHLEDQGEGAVASLRAMEEKQNRALERIEQGLERDDVGRLSWGAADLARLRDSMQNEGVLWTDFQKAELQLRIDRARQSIIQIFPQWLLRQMPANDSPVGVGDWKHRMLRLTGGNLQALSLGDQFEALEEHVQSMVRSAETAADARELLRTVRNWLSEHRDALRLVRVAALRGLKEVGQDFSRKLQGMAQRIELTELSETRTQLAAFLKSVKDKESEVTRRAMKLWGSKIRSPEDLTERLTEAEDLALAFEGCERDLDDMRLLSRGLRTYQHCYSRLEDENLTWPEFKSLAGQLEQEMAQQFEEGELPWAVDETFARLVANLSKYRKEQGAAWIAALESETESIQGMSAADASRLHERASRPPAYLTLGQSKLCSAVVRKLETHLSALTVEWLLERFKELPMPTKKAFLTAASKLVEK